MRVPRLFTREGESPYAQLHFVPRDSRITKLDGTVIFEAPGVMVPDTWDQVAVDVLAQKYFRRKGCNFNHPNSLYGSLKAMAIFGWDNALSPIAPTRTGENDLREVIHRIIGCWTHWGEEYGYFDTEGDSQAFYDELSFMMATQRFAPNSPQWFNTGLHYAYGIQGSSQGHYHVVPAGYAEPVRGFGDPIKSLVPELVEVANSYEFPQTSACFIQSVTDDLVHPGGIMDLFMREAKLFKYGSGSGTNYSKIRGLNEPLSGGGVSSGLMSFLKIGDTAGGSIKSGGTSRRAAKMLLLDADHPDIEAFINWKVSEEHKVAMLVAGSKALQATWKDMAFAYRHGTDGGMTTREMDASPKHNKSLAKAIKAALKAHVPMPFIAQCLQRLEQDDYADDVPAYSLDWDGDGYGTVSSQNANNSVRLPDAFMNAVIEGKTWDLTQRTTGEVCKTLEARGLWDKITHAAWMCADPGLQFSDTYNNWHTGLASGPINATNPCVVGSTLISTSLGYRRIQDLVGQTPAVVGLDGQTHQTTRVIPTGTKVIQRLTTKCGYTMDLTPDHRVWTENRGDVEASLLTKDDVVKLLGSPFGVGALPKDMAEVIGLVAGDGCITANRLALTMHPDHEREVLEFAAQAINGVIETSPWPTRVVKALDSPYTTALVTTHNNDVISLISSHLVADQGSENKKFKDTVFSLDEASLSALLRGLFTADGTVANYGERSQYVALDSCSLELLQQVQVILLQFGIKAKLYKNRRIGDSAALPDGKGGTKIYSVLQMHSLRISRSSRIVFEAKIGFCPESNKAAKLATLNRCVATYTDPMVDYVRDVSLVGEALVFDLTEPDTAHFVANGIAVHNCSEYAYIDDTACNLASTNLMAFTCSTNVFDIPAFEHANRLLTLALEITVAMSSFPSEALAQNSYEHRTLGLGFANLGTLLMYMGLPYASPEGYAIAGAITSMMTAVAYRTSAELAEGMGPYPAFELNKEHVCRVLRNHQRAANGDLTGYEGLNPQVQVVGLPPVDRLKAQDSTLNIYRKMRDYGSSVWSQAVRMAEEDGLRNAQVTVLAPTGTIGLVMGCDTTGVEPDFALVKFKKLAGGGYFRMVNQTVPAALAALGYSPTQIDDITTYISGTFITPTTPFINTMDLFAAGYSTDTVLEWNQKLPGAFAPSMVLPVDELNTKFAPERVANFLKVLRGSGTMEGAPHILDAHLAIFDCANKCGVDGKRFIRPMGHLLMMAATQPFISGSISKTVNLPADATIETFSEIFMTAWRMNIKSVALYRDGSKFSQPLSTNLDMLEGLDVLEEEETPVLVKVEAVAKAIAKNLTTPEPSTRVKLPGRRGGYTQAATIQGTKLYLHTGEYPDGTLGEIFLDMHKEGAAFRSIMNAFAIAISIGLQYGVPLEEFCDAFLFTKFEPQGPTQGHPMIKMSTSVVDFIFRDLAISYLGRNDLAHVKPEDLLNASGPRRPMATLASKAQHFGLAPDEEVEEGCDCPGGGCVAAPAAPAVSLHAQARQQGFTGDPCPTCGHLTMVRNGTCLKCMTCGSTTGCS